MKKWILYVILGVVFLAAISLMMGSREKARRIPDQRLTLRKQDKIPYGAWVAYKQLEHLFPSSKISAERSIPGSWDSLNNYSANQALLIISGRFHASGSELETLVNFAERGNHIFISAREFSTAAEELMKFNASVSFSSFNDFDTLEVKLKKPPFENTLSYRYPGRRFDSYFFEYDSSIAAVLGTDDNNDVNLLRFKVGAGNIFIHLAPITFTNYFLLHKQNINYYNNILSLIPPGVTSVVWDEYFLTKDYNPPRRRSGQWLNVLMKQPAFRWGLLTAIFAVLIYVLLEMRRKQRVIPVIVKPKNESLDFVKTIGRLYYDKQDHLNLSRKMASYFQEHVRSRYKLSTTRLDETFVKNLHFKSGYPEKDIARIVRFINFIETAPAVTDNQLSEFYKQLELFYKNT